MTWIYILLALVLWWWLWYAIAYTKFGNVHMVQELKDKFVYLQKEYEEQQLFHADLAEQNRILKQQAHMLLQQNEDFSKMVSELSRYYYRIKQWSSKLKELVDIMEVYDEHMDKKITRLMWEEISFDETMPVMEESGKKYF